MLVLYWHELHSELNDPVPVAHYWSTPIPPIVAHIYMINQWRSTLDVDHIDGNHPHMQQAFTYHILSTSVDHLTKQQVSRFLQPV